jgi:DHHC palmitoyltransferase
MSIELTNNNDVMNHIDPIQQRYRRPSNTLVVIRFVFISFFGIVLTISYPGHTLLRYSHFDNDNKIHFMVWWIILSMTYVMSLITFFRFHGSCPGYILQHHFQPRNDSCHVERRMQNKAKSILIRSSLEAKGYIYPSENTKKDKETDEYDMNYSRLHDPIDRENDLKDGKAKEMFASDKIEVTGSNGDSHHCDTIHNNKTYCLRTDYCFTCQFMPPIRSHHCPYCGHCIATFDHHCHFLNTCIGECNHFKFCLFLLSHWILCLLCCVIIVWSTNDDTIPVSYDYDSNGSGSIRLWNHIQQQRRWATQLYIFSLFMITSIMVVLHTWLIATNSTTFEYSKGAPNIDYLQGLDPNIVYPFNYGIVSNIYQFCHRRKCYNDTAHNLWKPIIWELPDPRRYKRQLSQRNISVP